MKNQIFRQLALICFTLVLSISQLHAAPYLKLTTNYKAELQGKTVLVLLTFGCDVSADARFQQCMTELNGVYVASYDVNSAYEMMQGKVYSINTIALIKNGTVIETSDETYKDFHYLSGHNNMRHWSYNALRRNNIAFTMPVPDEIKLKPINDGGSIQLSQGLNAIYRFEGNKKDETGKNSDFNIKGDAQLLDNAYYYAGKYDAKSGGEYYTGQTNNCLFTNGFTVHINVKLINQENVRRYVVGLGYRCIDFEINQNKLLMSTSIETSGDENKKYAEDFYPLTEIPFKTEEWNSIIFSTDIVSRRMSIMVNGVRYNDLQLSKDFIALFKTQCLNDQGYYGVRLHNYGGGNVLSGYADDIVVYTRKLNSNEMTALYNENKKGTKRKDIDPVDPVDAGNIWLGAWETSWGTSTVTAQITEVNGKIEGTYQHKNGTLKGMIITENGTSILSGTYSQDDSKGWFKFRMNPDQKSFTGEWGKPMQGKSGSWNGTKKVKTK